MTIPIRGRSDDRRPKILRTPKPFSWSSRRIPQHIGRAHGFRSLFTITIVGFFLLFIPWFILTVWYLYRVIRGWLRLNEGKPAPA